MNMLMRLLLRLVPTRWRASVERDLREEAERSGKTAGWRGVWLTWQALRVGLAFRLDVAAAPTHRSGTTARFVDGVARDLRHAARKLAREPWSSAAIACTLGLGIGASTAVYAVFNSVLLRPVPGVADPASLLTVRFQPPGRPRDIGPAPLAALAALRRAATGLRGLAFAHGDSYPFRSGADANPEVLDVEFVSSEYFSVLGVRTRLGRAFSDAEADVPGHDIALLSDALWSREFARDPDILGRQVFVNAHPFRVVGVIDRYRGWSTTSVGTVDVWLPASTASEITGTREQSIFELIGRRRPGASLPVIQEQLNTGFQPFASSKTSQSDAFLPVAHEGLARFGAEGVRQSILNESPLLGAACFLLFVLACANAANLLLARAAGRQRELTVHQAMGASRAGLVRALLLEAGLLSTMAAGLGLVTARGLLEFVGPWRFFEAGPAITSAPIDWRVAGFAVVAAGITAAMFGLVPAIAGSRIDLRSAMQEGRCTTPRARRARLALIGVQVAVSLALMSEAGVLMRSLANLEHAPLGMTPRGVISFQLNPRLTALPSAGWDALVRSTLERLGAEPGLVSVGYASPGAFNLDLHALLRLRPDAGAADQEVAAAGVVSGGYFATLGIPLVAGRTFTDAEFQRTPGPHGVAIVSQLLASRLFGGAAAVGHHIAVGGPPQRPWSFRRDVEIVGVVGDTRSGWQYRDDQRPAIYEPGGQMLVFGTVYAKSAQPIPEAMAAVRRVMRGLAPDLPLPQFGTLDDEVARVFPEDRTLATLTSLMALFATLIGTAGVYSVLTSLVVQRTREFGIRMALGATRARIARAVVADIRLTALAGAGAGLGLTATGSNLLRAHLYGVAPLDPATLSVVVILLSLAVLAASWLPARRATQADPVRALRTE